MTDTPTVVGPTASTRACRVKDCDWPGDRLRAVQVTTGGEGSGFGMLHVRGPLPKHVVADPKKHCVKPANEKPILLVETGSEIVSTAFEVGSGPLFATETFQLTVEPSSAVDGPKIPAPRSALLGVTDRALELDPLAECGSAVDDVTAEATCASPAATPRTLSVTVPLPPEATVPRLHVTVPPAPGGDEHVPTPSGLLDPERRTFVGSVTASATSAAASGPAFATSNVKVPTAPTAIDEGPLAWTDTSADCASASPATRASRAKPPHRPSDEAAFLPSPLSDWSFPTTTVDPTPAAAGALLLRRPMCGHAASKVDTS